MWHAAGRLPDGRRFALPGRRSGKMVLTQTGKMKVEAFDEQSLEGDEKLNRQNNNYLAGPDGCGSERRG
jgi:hypothetical protein